MLNIILIAMQVPAKGTIVCNGKRTLFKQRSIDPANKAAKLKPIDALRFEQE